MKHMKCIRAGILVFILCTFNLLSIFAEESSKTGKYPYNAVTSQKFNADVYGDHSVSLQKPPRAKKTRPHLSRMASQGNTNTSGIHMRRTGFPTINGSGKRTAKEMYSTTVIPT